jgi:hypothetical protein
MMAIRTFLARAVPWPNAAQSGYVNIHWQFRDDATGAARGVAGRAFSEHIRASNFTNGMLSNRVDLYVCMSLQSQAEHGINAKGKPVLKASRSAEDALLLRSFFIDIDVKPGHFTSTIEAKIAFDKWRVLVGLPEPTFIVLTGSGGFHVHWILDEPIPRDVWLPLAHALRNALVQHQFPHDPLIINPACILRIPGTKNFKNWTQPADVKLDQSLNYTYPLALIEKALEPYKVTYALPVIVQSRTMLGFKQSPKFAVLGKAPRLDAGIDEWVPTIDDVAKECGFIEATLANGGAGYHEPLWFESLKIASYCDDGSEVAHDLSRGHDGYSEEDTDKKYAQVLSSHAGGRIGWPQCRTINAAGATECGRCPHFKDGRSPLNYALPSPQQVVTPLPAPPPVPAPSASPAVTTSRQPRLTMPNFGYGDLPDDKYQYTKDGVIHVEVQDPDDPNKKFWEPVLIDLPIYDIEVFRPSMEGLGHHGVSFCVATDAVHEYKFYIKTEEVSDQKKFNAACGSQGGLYSSRMNHLRGLMTSFLEKLRAKGRVAKNSEAFGWSVEDKQSDPNAFCYGGVRYNGKGNSLFAPTDLKLGLMYQPTGVLDHWKHAASLIINQQRADLNAIIASSFGAPLIHWTGHAGIVLSAYSNASGIGKSHAMRIAQSVWGDPVRGMGGLDDTANYVNARVAMLRNLPFFYDELRQEEDTKKLVSLIFAMGQGKSKGRMTPTAEVREVHAFSTLLTAASNNSLMSYINDHVKTTPAGINRIFEMPVKTVTSGRGLIDPTAAQRINGNLNSNFGHAGAVYSQFLGSNIAMVKDAVAKASDAFDNIVKSNHDERFWVTALAITTMGAKFSNNLGLTTIDEKGLIEFLLEQFYENRGYRRASSVDIDKPDNALRYLQDYVNARREQTLVTDQVWTQPSRPPATFKPNVVNHQNRFDGRLVIRIAQNDQVMRISISDFGLWLKKERGVTRDVVIDALKRTMPTKTMKAPIGSNTSYKTAREDVLEFDLSQMPNLFD